ncbi:MAG: hypothetical protein AAGA60_12160 [Cyanobacteria bacterium P01_E01_bin.42]
MSLVKVLHRAGKFFLSGALIFALSWGLVGCGDRIESKVEQFQETEATLTEAAPPEAIVQLDRSLARYQPQVTILAPAPGEILEETDVAIALRVDDLPIYRDPDSGLGPHLALVLDNEPIRELYDLEESFSLEDVVPGTHTLRVFAVKPWGESFKNEGAYAQTTFSLFAPTPQNSLDASEPILTYNSPQGDYGAEPILLDFYVANAPLHVAARESNNDEITDWHIRANVNGTTFLLDRWAPIYLKGFEPGINWVKLEFLDEYNNPVENGFNTSVRIFNYQPNGQDTLSQLIRGEIDPPDAGGIVDPNYQPVEVAPTVEEESEVVTDSEEEILPEISEPVNLEENSEPSEEISPSEPETPLLEEIEEEVSETEVVTESQENIEEEIPEGEVIEEPSPVEDEVEETVISAPETELLETETEEPVEEAIATPPSDAVEVPSVEEEIAPPENPEVSESDRGFFSGLLDRFAGQTEEPTEAIEEVTEEPIPAVETIPETETVSEN